MAVPAPRCFTLRFSGPRATTHYRSRPKLLSKKNKHRISAKSRNPREKVDQHDDPDDSRAIGRHLDPPLYRHITKAQKVRQIWSTFLNFCFFLL